MKLELDGWALGLNFSACHFLTEHEKCSRLHGHNYGVSVKVKGDIGQNGMVMDFVKLKKAIKEVMDELDHKVMLPGNSKFVELEIGDTNIVARHGEKEYSLPLDDVVILDLPAISAEHLAEYFAARLIATIDFPPNVHEIRVKIDEGKGQGAKACRRL